MVMVELLLGNLLIMMSCGCCDLFDVAAAVVVIITVVVLHLQVQ